jgi:hypothetical protein
MKKEVVAHSFKLVPFVTKGMQHDWDEAKEDIQYWLTRPIQERLSAVTFLVSQSLAEGACMDKSVVNKKLLKDK